MQPPATYHIEECFFIQHLTPCVTLDILPLRFQGGLQRGFLHLGAALSAEAPDVVYEAVDLHAVRSGHCQLQWPS